MRSLGKLAGASLFEPSNFEMKAKNQDKSDRKEQKSLDNLIRQTIGKESLLSFPRSGENPAQLIHLLHAFEQQSGNKFSKGSTIELGMDSKDFTQDQNGVATPFSTESSTVKESMHSNLKETRSFGNSQQNPMEHMSSLKEVVAIAQAAAKVNGEPEKYLPGWPLLSKVQMLKCEKCSREFVSPLNHRRHIRVHRRLLNLEKGDSQKKRADLAEFWDKLSADEARQILSFKNVMLEEVPGSSIIKDMTSFIRKPGRLSLPQFYVKAGAALLDVAQMKSRTLSAADLFSILDEASEKTFLSAGTALSVQKFLFAGEAGKVILEVRNLVASMGFLVEQKLVKAWLVDKDAEALRCQKLLVEEEEAAEKKRAEQLERKRLKKLRQKELKEKEQAVNVEIVDTATSSPEVDGGGSLTAISSSSSASSEDASPSCADYYKDATVARENDIMSNADHLGPPDMDLDSVTGVPAYPELDYANQQGKLQDKASTDVNFVRSGREWKNSMETDLVLSQKNVSGSKNQQTFLKRTRKSSNASSSWQVASNGVLISDSVSGQRFASSNKPLVQRTSSGGNVYRIWTKKAHQISMANISIGLKTEDKPKDGADAACEVKLVDSHKSSSDFTDSGLICESTLMAVQEDFGIMAVETNTKSDVNDALKTPVLNDDSVTSHWTNPEVTGGELLIGSMSLCLDSFPNGVSKSMQVHSKDILLDQCNCSADGKDCNSISNCFDSSTECISASNTAGPLHLRVINNSSAKSHRSYADSSSDRDSLGHPPKQIGQGMLVKQELWQDGASKPGTKIWRPISHAMDCRGAEGITDCTLNSTQIEKDLMIDSQGRAAINATAHFSLKHENSRHQMCTQNGDSCFTNSESEQKNDTHQNGKQFGETVDRTLRNENKLQLLDATKEGSECFSRKQDEIVETIDQRETNFESACDAAAAFLSQRWEATVMNSEALLIAVLRMVKVKILVCSVFALVVVGIPAFAENCGRQASGAVCAGGECCSEWGWCGNTADHCKVPGCQSQCGGGAGPTPSGQGVASIITENVFNEMLKHRNEGSCPGKNFYTYNAFIAAANAFNGFGTTGDLTAQKRELAAFLAQTSHETTGGWATAPDGPYAWGYCFLTENGGGDYCNSQQAPCASGKQYYGRGPIQLSWNYNYIAAGKAIGFDGLNDPDIVARDSTISFKTAIWFWMTAQSPKPSCHDVMTGRWTPSGSDNAAGRVAGYGLTTNIINGGLECGKGSDSRVEDRIGFYKRYCDILGVSYGSNLDCFNQRPFGFALTTQQPPQVIQTVV